MHMSGWKVEKCPQAAVTLVGFASRDTVHQSRLCATSNCTTLKPPLLQTPVLGRPVAKQKVGKQQRAAPRQTGRSQSRRLQLVCLTVTELTGCRVPSLCMLLCQRRRNGFVYRFVVQVRLESQVAPHVRQPTDRHCQKYLYQARYQAGHHDLISRKSSTNSMRSSFCDHLTYNLWVLRLSRAPRQSASCSTQLPRGKSCSHDCSHGVSFFCQEGVGPYQAAV